MLLSLVVRLFRTVPRKWTNVVPSFSRFSYFFSQFAEEKGFVKLRAAGGELLGTHNPCFLCYKLVLITTLVL